MNIKFLFALIIFLLPETSIGTESDKQDDWKIKLPSSDVLSKEIDRIFPENIHKKVCDTLGGKETSLKDVKNVLYNATEDYLISLQFLQIADTRFTIGMLNDIESSNKIKIDIISASLAKNYKSK